MIIRRLSDDGFQTLGIATMPNGKVYHTLELSWKNNQKQISCIPKGNYKLKKRYSAKYGHHLHVQNVPNRDFILLHSGNYHTDILGCLIFGKGLKDINGDGRLDVTSSRQALKEIGEAFDKMPFDLTIL